MCNLTFGPREGLGQGEGVGTPRGQGTVCPAWQRCGWAGGLGGGPHSLSASVSDSPFVLLPGCPGWGTMQLRAGAWKRGEGDRASCPPGQGREGWAGACPGQGGGEGQDPSPRVAPAKAWKDGQRLGTPASFWGLAGPQPAPWPWVAYQVTRILCFGIDAGVGCGDQDVGAGRA